MAKVVMTKYSGRVKNVLVYPQCPHAGCDEVYDSLEVECMEKSVSGLTLGDYCSTLNEQGICPFGK